MRILLLIVSTLFGCGPEFDIGERDGGAVDAPTLDGGAVDVSAPSDGTMDASTLDDGDADVPVLAQTNSCADIFERVDESYGFDEVPEVGFYDWDDVRVVGGSLPLSGGNYMYTLTNFRSAATCTELRLPPTDADRAVWVATKSPRANFALPANKFREGVSCVIDGGNFEMIESYPIPESNGDYAEVVLDRHPAEWLNNEREVRVFTYSDGNQRVCEVVRLDTGEVVRLETHGATALNELHYEIQSIGESSVHEVFIGVPYARFRRLSE